MLENPTVWLWPEFLQNSPAVSLADCWYSWLYCICLSYCTSILNWALQHCIVETAVVSVVYMMFGEGNQQIPIQAKPAEINCELSASFKMKHAVVT